jgi:hypothetical protein
MRDYDRIKQDIEDLISGNYYAEDFELIASIRDYISHLDEEELTVLHDVVLERIYGEPNLVNILLCSCVDVPEAVPFLIEMLDAQDQANQLSRQLINVLRRYPDERAFQAVSRFIDSGQQPEALTALSEIHFENCIPYMRQCMEQDGLYSTCLHILHRRHQARGLNCLTDDLAKLGDSIFRRKHLEAMFMSLPDEANPFEEDVVNLVVNWVRNHPGNA